VTFNVIFLLALFIGGGTMAARKLYFQRRSQSREQLTSDVESSSSKLQASAPTEGQDLRAEVQVEVQDLQAVNLNDSAGARPVPIAIQSSGSEGSRQTQNQSRQTRGFSMRSWFQRNRRDQRDSRDPYDANRFFSVD